MPNIPEQARNYLTYIDHGLAVGMQIRDTSAAQIDQFFLPMLIDQANMKYPGLNTQFASMPAELALKVKQLIAARTISARFISKMSGGLHFAAIDFRLIGGKASVIAVESSGQSKTGPLLLGVQITAALADQQVPARFVVLQSCIQKSGGECAMFSLSFAKKMFQEKAHFARLHQMNLDNLIQKEGSTTFATRAESLALMPASLARHAQSSSWMTEYLSHHPHAATATYGKHNETLQGRFERYTIQSADGRCYSNSIEQKRRKEISRLA